MVSNTYGKMISVRTLQIVNDAYSLFPISLIAVLNNIIIYGIIILCI